MAQINLAPEAQFVAAARRRRAVLYGLTAAIAIVVALAWMVGIGLQQRVQAQLTKVTEQAAKLNTEIARLGNEADRVESFEARLGVLDTLLDNHVKWTPLLQEFERLLPSVVVLTEMTLIREGTIISLSGRSPNLGEVANLMASLKTSAEHQTIFTEATLLNAEREERRDVNGSVVEVYFTWSAEVTLAQ
jgi:Tfp pilus assembly protein PilN